MDAVIEEKYHTTITDLTLARFIECEVDGNLSALIISGFPDREKLTMAWDNILAEHAERVGSSEYKLYIELYKEISILNITLIQIKEAINILRLYRSQYFVDAINDLLKTSCKFNWNDQKSYQAECDKCINRSKSLKIKYDLKCLQLEAIQKKAQATKGEKPTRDFYTSVLVTLSDHAKYRIEETIKMPEYYERLRRFNEHRL